MITVRTLLLMILFTLNLIPYVFNFTNPKWSQYDFYSPVKLKFDGCNKNGWTCSISSDEMRVIFTCPKDFEDRNPIVKWTFEGLSPMVKSVTLQNCNLALQIDEETVFKLNRFIVKNITELSIVPRKREIYLKSKYNKFYESRMSILIIENVRFIRQLIFGTVWGKFDELSIRRCKIGRLEWHAFHHINATLFDFTENEVNVVKGGAFNVVADRVTIVGNTFNYLENGAFFEIAIGDNGTENGRYTGKSSDPDETNWKPVIQFESNTIYESEVGGLHIGKPVSYIADPNSKKNITTADGNTTVTILSIPEYKVSVRHNEFNCRPTFTKWLYDVAVNVDEENEKKLRLQESRKIYFDKVYRFLLYYVIDFEDNVCYNIDCSMSLGLFKDRYLIYGPNRNICDDTLEFNSTVINAGDKFTPFTYTFVISNLIFSSLFLPFRLSTLM